MTGLDEAELVSHLHTRGFALVGDRSNSNHVVTLTSMPEQGSRFSFTIWLWLERESPPPTLTWIESQRHFVVDRFASEVIEFSRSFVHGRELVRGRLWAEFDYLQGEQIIRKGEEFRRAFDSLKGWIESRAVRSHKGDSVLSGADAFVKSGGVLVHGVQNSDLPIIKHHDQG